MGISPEDAERQRQRMERLPRVAERYLKGWSVRKIAAAEGVTPRVIYKDREVLHKIWSKDAARSVKLILARELAKLDNLEREAWDRHEESCKDAVERRNTTITGGEKGDVRTRSKTRRGQSGDPRWMAMILQCMDRRRLLLRLDAEDKGEAGQLHTQIVEVVVENPEQVQQIITYATYEDIQKAAEE